MASLYLTEFSGAGAERTQVAKTPRVNMQKLTIGSEVKSTAFKPETSLIRVHVDAICSIAIGDSPTASTSDSRMSADTTEYFAVRPGDKLSVISNT